MSKLAFAGFSVLTAVLASASGAFSQIVPHTSDKASAAYSPAAVVQTRSRLQTEYGPQWPRTVASEFHERELPDRIIDRIHVQSSPQR